MAASLAIHRLCARTPARAQPVAARLALQALGADLEDALPRGLPPQALLWLRRMRLQAPEAALLRPAPLAWRQDWIAAGRERLDAALAQAARPALGPVPEDAEAVLFADAAEMLACLALAARAGQLDRWWWRGLLGRTWPHWQTAWAARPQARAAAQRLLLRAGQGRVTAFDVELAQGAVGPDAVVVALTTALPLPGRTVGAVEETAAEGWPPAMPRAAVDGQAPDRARPVAVVVDDAVAMTPAAVGATTPPKVRSSVSVDSTRSQQVTLAEAAAPTQPLAAVQPLPAVSQRVVLDQPPPFARGIVQIDARLPSIEASPAERAMPRGDPFRTPRTEQQLAAMPALQAIAQPPVVVPDEALQAPELPMFVATSAGEIAASTSRREAPPENPPSPPATVLRAESEFIAPDAAWPWPQALLSCQTPLLFVVNALLEDGLYPDFTRPRDPGLPVPLWALLAALAQAWRLAQDPLQATLAERAGDWVAPERMPDVPGAPAGPWPVWLPAYARSLRRRLCRRLGIRAAQWPRALMLAHPARLWLSEAEWVAEFDLAGHDVAWRLAGLDRDPGWLPSAGCSLRFEFA